MPGTTRHELLSRHARGLQQRCGGAAGHPQPPPPPPPPPPPAPSNVVCILPPPGTEPTCRDHGMICRALPCLAVPADSSCYSCSQLILINTTRHSPCLAKNAAWPFQHGSSTRRRRQPSRHRHPTPEQLPHSSRAPMLRRPRPRPPARPAPSPRFQLFQRRCAAPFLGCSHWACIATSRSLPGPATVMRRRARGELDATHNHT